MDNAQFERLITEMAGIKDVISNKIAPEVNNNKSVINIHEFRQAFFKELERKTSWGRNELKTIFEVIVDDFI